MPMACRANENRGNYSPLTRASTLQAGSSRHAGFSASWRTLDTVVIGLMMTASAIGIFLPPLCFDFVGRMAHRIAASPPNPLPGGPPTTEEIEVLAERD